MTVPSDIALPPGWGGGEPVRLRWIADDGASVLQGQPLCEIESAKAIADVLASRPGTLRWAVADGAVAPGTLLGLIVGPGETVPPVTVPARVPGPVSASTLRKETEIRVLREGREGALPSTVMAQVPIRDLADRLREDGTSISAVVVHEVACALRRYPVFNAGERVRIGVALDVEPHGLKVAAVDDADTKTVDAIAAELQVLLYRYMTRALSPADLAGATFTITDLTSFGAAWSVPLLVGRQAAILGVGIVPDAEGRALTLSLTFDHRVASGREAALFVRDVARRVREHARRATPSCARCQRSTSDMVEGRRYLLVVVTDDGQASVCPDCVERGRA